MRFFVFGTDTDVGKTRVTAALAAALVLRGQAPMIVKAVQTGVAPGENGDAAEAGLLAGCNSLEFARFRLPADAWSAALADGAPPLEAAALARQIEAVPSPVVVEGAGGAAVPINATETLTSVAALTTCRAIVVTGVRLGCISHTLLTLSYLAAHRVPVCGVVLADRWGKTTAAERERVVRAIAPHAQVLGVVEHDTDAQRSVIAAAKLFDSVLAPDSDKVGLRV